MGGCRCGAVDGGGVECFLFVRLTLDDMTSSLDLCIARRTGGITGLHSIALGYGKDCTAFETVMLAYSHRSID